MSEPHDIALTVPEEQHMTFVWKIFERRFEVYCDGKLLASSSSISTFALSVADMFRLSGKGLTHVSISTIAPASTKVQ